MRFISPPSSFYRAFAFAQRHAQPLIQPLKIFTVAGGGDFVFDLDGPGGQKGVIARCVLVIPRAAHLPVRLFISRSREFFPARATTA